MKKLLAIILAAIMLMSLVSCGSTAGEGKKDTDEVVDTTVPEVPEETTENTPATDDVTPAKHVLADFKENVTDDAKAYDLADTLMAAEWVPFGPAVMEVEPGFLNGFSAEVEGFEEGAMFGPMIGSMPFVGYIFKLADGADVDAFISTLKELADLRWNICTQADELVCEAEGNTVLFVMAPNSFDIDE